MVKPLLDSIALQQSVDFNEVGVIIVNDGSDVFLSDEFLNSYPFKVEYDVVNLCDIEAKYADGETVSKETLIAKNLVKSKKSLIKLLGTGNLTKKVTVSVDKISKSAKEKVEKAGGSVVEVKKAEKTEKKD